jgi:uncharacterized protein (TIGR04255 family)
MRLRNAPLVHVLAQAVFPPVLNWKDRVSDLQDRLIDLGFPRTRREDVAELAFSFGMPPGAVSPGADAGPQGEGAAPGAGIRQSVTSHWEFAERFQRTAFVLSESSFVLHTTAYSTVEPFLDLFRRGLEALRGSMKVTLVERLGLRYIDLVQPDPGQPFSEYVHPGLLGYPFRESPELEATGGGFATQSVATTPKGTLAIRSAVVPPGQYLPPDLNPGSLLRPEHVDLARPGLAVDFDHFTVFSGPRIALDFDPMTIVSHMDQLHTTVRSAFDVIATPYAIERWGPWEEVPQA